LVSINIVIGGKVYFISMYML